MRRSNISHLDYVVSKKLLGIRRTTSEYFDFNASLGETILADAVEVQKLIKQDLPLLNALFANDILMMRLMPMMALKIIVELYGCGTPDFLPICSVNLTTTEPVSYLITAVAWLTWLMTDSKTFTRSLADQYSIATDVHLGQRAGREAINNDQVHHDHGAYCRPALLN